MTVNSTPIDHHYLFDSMPVKRYLIALEDGVFILKALNKLAVGFIGKKNDDVIDQPFVKAVGEVNFNHMKTSLEVCYYKKLPVTIPPLPEILADIKSTGFWVNPILNNDGEVLFLDIIGQPSSTDVSIIERERDDALSLLTAIFDASEVGILVLDRHRKIIKVNNSFGRIFGWNNEQMLDKDFLEFITHDERKLAERKYTRYLEQDGRMSGEVKIYCQDGTIAVTMYTTATLKLSQGRRFQVVTLVDISKWKQVNMSLKLAKDQADSANNAKSSFLANMSHELRTPLNAIIGFSEMMKNETFGPLGSPKYLEYLTDVHMSATHLLDIINEVLDMSKIESGKIELDEQEIDLNTLIKTLTRIMHSRALNEDIEIIEHFQEDLPKLYADPRLVRQILINLITNSIKYSTNSGKITITTLLNKKGEVDIIVEDQGIGIPADRIKDAMEPFGQIHDPATHSEVYQGTGLGLPLAKAMVEMHGGVFTLSSIEGEGTKVNISFSPSRTRHH